MDPTIKGNPYLTPAPLVAASPSVMEKTLSASCSRRTIWWIVYLYPVWLVGSFYAVWMLAWVQLGHRPRPMLDDPKSIGGWMDVAYPIPGLLLMAIPVLTPLGFVASFFKPVRTRTNRQFARSMSFGFVYVVLCGCALTLLRIDSGSAITWWFD